MSSIRSEVTDYSKYSAYDEADSTITDKSLSFAVQSKTAAGSLSLADANFGNINNNNNRVKNKNLSKQRREYSSDEFLYALSSPAGIGAMAWIVSSVVAVIYGSSIAVLLNFCIPLFMGPYVISEQMRVQSLPSARRKSNKLYEEANALALENVQLKGAVSRLQRQEYRLSVVEERFEHICKRSDKDISKMKHLAKKNAGLRQTIKENLAAKKVQELMASMLTADYNGNYLISEKEIDEVVMFMKAFAGRNASKFDKAAIHEAVVLSMANNTKVTLIPKSNFDESNSVETGDSEREGDERMSNEEEVERRSNDEEMEEINSFKKDISVKSSQQSFKKEPNNTEELRPVSNNSSNLSLKLDTSSHLVEKQNSNEDYVGMVQATSNGTMDSPIDIENLLFNNSQYMEEDQRHHYSAKKEFETTTLPPIE